MTGRWRELLYEIHGYGIPRLLGNRKLLEKSVGFVVHGFGMGTSGARFAVVLDVDWKSRPIVLHTDESSSDRNDLQGDGRASTGEHVVGDCQSSEHRCVRGGGVNHRD